MDFFSCKFGANNWGLHENKIREMSRSQKFKAKFVKKINWWVLNLENMRASCHFDRTLNVEIIVEYRISFIVAKVCIDQVISKLQHF